jgi:hypothetical protein
MSHLTHGMQSAGAGAFHEAPETPDKVYLLGAALDIRDETSGNIITPRTDDVLRSLNVKSWTVFSDREAALYEQRASASLSTFDGKELVTSQRALFSIIPKEFGDDMIIEEVRSYAIPGIELKERIELDRKENQFIAAGLQNLLILATSTEEAAQKDETLLTSPEKVAMGIVFIYMFVALFFSIAQNENAHPLIKYS